MPRCKASRPTSAVTEREPRDGDLGRIAFVATTEHHAQQDQAVRADIIGSDQCRAEGYTVRGASPVLKLCRKLVEAGFNPSQRLTVVASYAPSSPCPCRT